MVLVGIVLVAIYGYLYYPQQIMPIGEEVSVVTPIFDKYRNDCLHPCIRYDEDKDEYHMAQSPYYGWDNKVENPMFYTSTDYTCWNNGSLLAETPLNGYNSDPCILVHKDTIIYVWRECSTPLCDSLNVANATVGGYMADGILVNKKVWATNSSYEYDTEQCPILWYNHKKDSLYLYAAWYQYYPNRISNGIAIWRGKGFDDPALKLVDTIRTTPIHTVDKIAQISLLGHIWYLPKPQKHDLWHFDLFEYDNKLYMVSVAEKGDNIMLSVSEDYMHFKTYRKPLINNHYSENHIGYRQYYYKPTAFVKNDSLFLFYTANAKQDPNRNQLFVTSESMTQVLKQVD